MFNRTFTVDISYRACRERRV